MNASLHACTRHPKLTPDIRRVNMDGKLFVKVVRPHQFDGVVTVDQLQHKFNRDLYTVFMLERGGRRSILGGCSVYRKAINRARFHTSARLYGGQRTPWLQSMRVGGGKPK